jgi:methionine sulfoxide reductase heme-binding subunit
LIKALKVLAFVLCLVPFFLLVWAALTNNLGANPVEAITHTTGDWILRFLVLTLCLTPLRRLTGWAAVTRYRRMFGLFAFFYSCLHFTIYCLSIANFDWAEIGTDIAKRPYVTVGFTAWVLMIPLAITSTKKWIGRLGGKRWQLLHRLVYVTAILGVLHYLWLVKLDKTFPERYGIVIGLLLLVRVWTAFRSRHPVIQVSGGKNAVSRDSH